MKSSWESKSKDLSEQDSLHIRLSKVKTCSMRQSDNTRSLKTIRMKARRSISLTALLLTESTSRFHCIVTIAFIYSIYNNDI